VTDAFVSLARYVAQPAKRTSSEDLYETTPIHLSQRGIGGRNSGRRSANGHTPRDRFTGTGSLRASRIAIYLNDYGELARYRAANAALKAPARGENRVVFWRLDH